MNLKIFCSLNQFMRKIKVSSTRDLVIGQFSATNGDTSAACKSQVPDNQN